MSSKQRILVTAALFLISFLSAMEATIVTTAMPTIIGDLQGVEFMNWVMSIYLLACSMTTPLYGKLADYLGRRSAFNLGISLFLIGALCSGLSGNLFFLIFSRLIQGLGAGAMMPLSMILLTDMYDVDKRAKMLGMEGAIWGVAGLVGPLIGGVIVQNFHWHWVFFVNLPIGLLAMAAISFGLKRMKRKERSAAPFDVLGVFWLMVAIASFMLVIQWLGEGKFSLFEFAPLGLCVLAVIFFVRTEKKAADPAVSLALFRNKNFVIYNFVGFVINGFLIALDVYIPMWVQVINGESPIWGGVVGSPLSFLWMVGAFFTARITGKYGLRRTLRVGSTLSIFCALLFVWLPEHPSLLTFFVLGAIAGIVLGIIFTVVTIGVQQSVKKEEIGVAMGINSLVRMGANTVMIAVYGAVLNGWMSQRMVKGANMQLVNQLLNAQSAHSIPKSLVASLRQLLYQGMGLVFWIVTFTLLVNALVVLLVRTPNHFDELGNDSI